MLSIDLKFGPICFPGLLLFYHFFGIEVMTLRMQSSIVLRALTLALPAVLLPAPLVLWPPLTTPLRRKVLLHYP